MKKHLALVCCCVFILCCAGAGPEEGGDHGAGEDVAVGTSQSRVSGSSAGPSASSDGPAAPPAASSGSASGSPGAGGAPSPESAQAAGAALLTTVPDPCEYLTRADAEELLGEPTGPGVGHDAGGWNCVYDTSSSPRRRLVLDMYVGRGRSLESTQMGMRVQSCESEIVRRLDDLGAGSALYRDTAEFCDGDTFLWVVTEAVFQGRVRPMAEREMTGFIQFAVALSPMPPDEVEGLTILRGAAERVVARLSR